jgi:hydroxymethylglutaryl-CoA reductase
MLVVHLLVDTRDAMGANLVNTMCEGVASLVESLTGGKVFLRILSNLADRSLARAEVRCRSPPWPATATTASRCATASSSPASSPGRPLPGRHPQQGHHERHRRRGAGHRQRLAGRRGRRPRLRRARHGRYTSLSRWRDDDGALAASIELPLKVGIVGGPLSPTRPWP